MGIFDRIATLFKSNINDLISSAENPEKMLIVSEPRGTTPVRECAMRAPE